MFVDPAPSPLDIHFRVGPFPVRVSPWFFAGMALIGMPTFADPVLGPVALAVFILAGFLSVLVHELGHAVASRAFRRPTAISLIMFGGYAAYYDGEPRQGWQRLVTALAGPAAGLLFAFVVLVSNMSALWSELHPVLGRLFVFLLVLNVVWSLLNLVPVWPLDGGRALREVLYICGNRRPDVPTHTAGLVGGGAICLVGLLLVVQPDHWIAEQLPYRPGFIMALFFGLFAYNNYQMLQLLRGTQRYDEDDGEHWKRYR